jgi:HK97 gp10 family phage protein
MSIALIGLGKALVGMANWNSDVANELREAVADTADKVLDAARSRVPVKSGLLAASLHITINKSGFTAKVKTDEGTAPHGHLIHFGTVKMIGNAFLYHANEQYKDQFLDRCSIALGRDA